MHTLKEIIEAIGKLSDAELTELRARLSSRDEPLEFTDEFEAKIKASERQMASGQRPRPR